MKKIDKKQWQGYNAFRLWKGDLEGAKEFYKLKGINLKQGFFDGWELAMNSKLDKLINA